MERKSLCTTYQISWVHFALGTLKDNKLPLVANKGH